MVSDRFGMAETAAGIHAADRARSLRDCGATCAIVTRSSPEDAEADLVSGVPEVPRTWTIQTGFRRLMRRWAPSDRPDVFAPWHITEAYRTTIERLLREREFDVLYSTGGVAMVHLAAEAARARTNAGIQWIAEIQDPLTFEGMRGPTYRASNNDVAMLTRTEQALERADAVICLTRACAEHYRQRRPGGEWTYLYPGSRARDILPSIVPAPRDDDRLRLYYGGTLIGERNLDVLLAAIVDAGLQK
ncbi:MAG: glycosyltransferase, partial [Vicinamibacterales bacterium]